MACTTGGKLRNWSPIDVLPEILMDVPDMVFAYTRDVRYLFVNAAAADFLNADPSDVIGRHWRDLGYPPAVMLPLTLRVEAVASTGEAEYHRFTSTPERGLRTFDMSLTPLWSEQGNVLAVLAIAHDISEFCGTNSASLS
jgi:PAS domain S-box-containing protein